MSVDQLFGPDLMRKHGQINASNLATSERLQRLLAFLQRRRGVWSTSMTITRQAGVAVPHSAIAELRANGAVIDMEYRLIGGKKRPAYQLKASPEGWA